MAFLVKVELEKAYTDRDTKRIVELDKCQNTLDWLIDYHNIEIDEDIDFDEEGYERLLERNEHYNKTIREK